MKKYIRLIAVLLTAVLLMASVTPSFAYNSAEHDKTLERILFDYGDIPAAGENAIQMLEAASYLCIDQYNGNGADQLAILSSGGVSNLPKSISEIDFTSNSTHRRYTHQGWNYTYTGEKDKANWPERKIILCSTANELFDFGVTNEVGTSFCQECDNFCALVYYVHLLGDSLADKSYKAASEQLPFAVAHVSQSNPDYLYELEQVLKVLFSDQKSTYKYSGMMSKIDGIAKKARSLVASQGGINTEEKFATYKDYEEQLLEVLESYIPKLLKNEPFFKKTFCKCQ